MAVQLAKFEEDRSVGLVYTGFYLFPGNDLRVARKARVIDITIARDLSRAYFLNDPPIIPSTIVLRRSAFEAIGGFDATIKVFEDTDFYLRLSRICRFGFCEEPLIYKRNRGTSITGGSVDLMAHHAFVAFRFAAVEPKFLTLVPKRLAERARKLGNHNIFLGNLPTARRHLELAVKLDRWNMMARATWLAFRFAPGLASSMFKSLLAPRRDALGSNSHA